MKLTGHNADTNDGMVPLSEDRKENKKAAESNSEALASVLPPTLTYIHSCLCTHVYACACTLTHSFTYTHSLTSIPFSYTLVHTQAHTHASSHNTGFHTYAST